MTLLVVAACVLFLAIVLLGQYRTFAIQYLWFCRFPLMAGLVLLALPILAVRIAPSMLRNLLVLTPLGMAQVALWASFAAWTVMFTLVQIAQGVSLRCNLDFERTREEKARENPPGWLVGTVNRVEGLLLGIRDTLVASTTSAGIVRATLFFLLFAAPTIVVAIGVSREGNLPSLLLAAAIGVLLPALLRLPGLAEKIDEWSVKTLVDPLKRTSGLYDRLPGAMRRGLIWFDDDTPREHARGLGLFAIVLVLYLVGYQALKPIHTGSAEIPALAFVLVLLIMTCMILSFLSYLLDPYRVPLIPFVVGLSFLGFWWLDRDHYYEVLPVERTASVAPIEAVAAYRAWHETYGEEPLVVVAGSGGGITASFWTARVLTGLQADTEGRFGRSMALLSTVSGGSVGGMYFVDRYRPEGPPTAAADLDSILDRSGRSSLAASAWGLVYPDFWRTFGVTFANLDRGWAIEQPWRRWLAGKDARDHRMSGWRDGLSAGWRPPQVFNATLVESGERLSISPVRLTDPDSAPRGARNFLDLYGADLSLATAARLSATFPFVTPVARLPEGFVADSLEFHVADGGYYDNFGVVSAIEYLETILPRYVEDGGKDVVFVKIALSEFRPRTARKHRGWVYSAAGPLLTMMHVRTSAQVARNDLELRLFQKRWQERGLTVHLVEFLLRDRDAPLSWHLTRGERCRIDRIWWTNESIRQGRAYVDSMVGASPALARGPDECPW